MANTNFRGKILDQKRTIVLASTSQRRKELLEKLGLKFRIDPGEFPEKSRSDLPPEGLVKYNSIGKATAIAAKYPDAVIIAADTIGVIRNHIIGKPQDAKDAEKMLRNLSGKTHRVITGLTVLDTGSEKMLTRTVVTFVHIKELKPEEIFSYIKTGEPLDKAGAYAIQGLGALIVEKINGDYYNVVGLPLKTLADCLKECGINLL
jgi:septum formation protein